MAPQTSFGAIVLGDLFCDRRRQGTILDKSLAYPGKRDIDRYLFEDKKQSQIRDFGSILGSAGGGGLE